MSNPKHTPGPWRVKHWPDTWNELLDSSYVCELTEDQVAVAKSRLNPTPDWKFRTPDEDLELSHELESKLRGPK